MEYQVKELGSSYVGTRKPLKDLILDGVLDKVSFIKIIKQFTS